MHTRSSTVLGKRAHEHVASSTNAKVEQLQTPDNSPNPKRARTTAVGLGDDSNKENIPPFEDGTPDVELSPRATRALRRTSTEVAIISARHPLRRTSSATSTAPATPTAEISQLAISTPPPTPPAALLPLHVRVRALLRPTCNGSQTDIAGHDAERASIMRFLSHFSCDDTMDEDSPPTSLFISGSPGTGKTALVNSLIRDVEDSLRVVFINCMALKSVDALWERMIEEFSDVPKRKAAGKKLKGRDAVISRLAALRTKCLLVLDELDHITPNPQALASVFSLPEKHPNLLRLIGIANTHTLTSSTASSSATSVRTIHFAPYTPTQLQAILTSRLNALATDNNTEMTTRLTKFLPTPTLMLLTKKVAALTGDVRSLFEVLRGAIDIAVVPSVKGKVIADDENPLVAKPITVTPQHILAALKAYKPVASPATQSSCVTTTNSETVMKIQNLGLQARVVLLTILMASKRLDAGLPISLSSNTSPKKLPVSPVKRTNSLPSPPTTTTSCGINTGVLYTYYCTILGRTECGLFEPVSKSEFGDIMGILETVGIVSLSSSLLCASLNSSPTKGRRAFSRSASFANVGSGKNGAGAIGEVKLVEGIMADEVLRGLGVSATPIPRSEDAPTDAQEEEIVNIWEHERCRLKRDVKAAIAATKPKVDLLADAFED